MLKRLLLAVIVMVTAFGSIHGYTINLDDIRFDSRSKIYDPESSKARDYYRQTDLKHLLNDGLLNNGSEYLTNTRRLDNSVMFGIIFDHYLDSLYEMSYVYISVRDVVDRMRKNVGKNYFKSIEESYGEEYADVAVYAGKNGFSLPSERDIIVSLLPFVEKEKDKKAIMSDAEKGVISKKLKKLLEGYSRELNQTAASYYKLHAQNKQLDREILYRRSLQKIKEKNVMVLDGKEYPVPEIVLIDTVPNPCYRKTLYDKRNNSNGGTGIRDLLEYDAMSKDFAWVEDEQNRKRIHESYPVSVEFYKYDAHPDYRVIHSSDYSNYGIYDSAGNLVHITQPDYAVSFNDMGRHNSVIGKQIALYAFNKNDHDINNASAATKKYVKLQLGIEQLSGSAKAKQEKATDRMAKALAGSVMDDMRYGSKSRKGKAAARKHAMNFFDALLSASSDYDSSGSGWFNQIENDYWEILKNGPYMIERLSDTAFRIIYVNDNYEPVLTIDRSYQNDGPYKTKEIINVEFLD